MYKLPSSGMSKTLSNFVIGTAAIASIYALYTFGKEVRATMDEGEKDDPEAGGRPMDHNSIPVSSGCPIKETMVLLKHLLVTPARSPRDMRFSPVLRRDFQWKHGRKRTTA